MKKQRFIVRVVLTAALLGPAPFPVLGASDPDPPARPTTRPNFDARLEEIDLRDAPLRDALSLIGRSSGLNMAASDEAAKVKVTVRLHNVSAFNAVQTICQTHGLFFKKPTDEGIGIVTTAKEFQEGLTVFRDQKTEVYTLLYPNAVDLAVAIRDLYGDRVRLSLGKENVYDESDDIQRRFDRFDQLDSHSQGLTQSFTSGGSGGNSGGNGGGGFGNSNGGGSSGRGAGGGSSSSRGGIGGLGQQSDTTAQQKQNDLRDLNSDQLARIADMLRQNGAGLGVDADKIAGLRRDTTAIYVTVIRRNNQIIVRTSDPEVQEEIGRLKAKIDVPTPQVLLEVKVMSVDLSDGFSSIFDMQFGDSHNTGTFSTGNIQQPTPPSGAVGGTGALAPFGLDQTSMVYQWVDQNFRARMQMLDNTNRVTSLATPLLLVANNEVSRVFVGEQYPIVQGINVNTTQNQAQTVQSGNTQFNFQPVGTTLLITPNINADHTVTLRLVQETSAIISGGATVPIVTSTGGITNQPVDVVSARTLTGTMIAKDGLSLALGGLIEEGVQDTRQEVPVLGQLPIVGILFRRQVTGRYRRELVVVIRPYILSTPAEAEAAGKRLIEANSIHPKVPDVYPANGAPIGSMNTYLPHEVPRPNPPRNDLERIFRFHSVLPAEF
ncbi:MAG: hypothetical protein ABSH20_19640 [Tepidisphaeraceae bacterium]